MGLPFECIIRIQRSDSRSIAIVNSVLLGTLVGTFPSRLASIIHVIIGFFNPGPQPRGTPIIADVTDDPVLQVNVLWKNARNLFATSTWGPGRNSSWSTGTPSAEVDRRALLDGSG